MSFWSPGTEHTAQSCNEEIIQISGIWPAWRTIVYLLIYKRWGVTWHCLSELRELVCLEQASRTNVHWDLKERRLVKLLPDMLASLMNGAGEMMEKEETILSLAVLGLVYILIIFTRWRRPAHTFLHEWASIWVFSMGRTVLLHYSAPSFYVAQAWPTATLNFTKRKEKHGIKLIWGNLRRVKSHHFECCLKPS